MDETFKKAWVDALKSGKYKQTNGVLKEEVKGELRYCCLGVACELAIEMGLTDLKWEKGEDYDQNHFFLSSVKATVPEQIQKALGISDVGHFTSFDGSKKTVTVGFVVGNNLAVLNDNRVSFMDIAKAIEKNF